MPRTTDFQRFLNDGNEPRNYEEAYGLHLAASGQGGRHYEITESRDGKRFIKGAGGLTLALVSEGAIADFATCVDQFKDDHEMDWETWYARKCAEAQDN